MQLIKPDVLIEYANNQKSGSITANDIARFPTVEANPVAHAHWIVERFAQHLTAECSHCRSNYYVHNRGQYHIEHSKRCPNCGAHMDEPNREITREVNGDDYNNSGLITDD